MTTREGSFQTNVKCGNENSEVDKLTHLLFLSVMYLDSNQPLLKKNNLYLIFGLLFVNVYCELYWLYAIEKPGVFLLWD